MRTLHDYGCSKFRLRLGMLAVLAVAAMTAMAGCGGSSSSNDSGGSNGSGAAGPAWRALLNERVPAAMKKTRVPGAIVGVWREGKPVYLKAFGVADIKTRTPMRTDLHMRIGSLTKTFTITGILQLVKAGKIALDDPISKYVSGVPKGDIITLRNLAEMRSGLADYVPVIRPNLYKHPEKQWTPKELLDIAFGEPMHFEPGAKFDYVNTNTVLLGQVIEKVSGMSRQEYVKERIIDPLGLDNTSVPTDNAIPDPHSQGYGPNPQAKPEDVTRWSPSQAGAAGDMISSAEDVAKWTRGLALGELITPELQREREKGGLAPSEGPGARYGLAYEIHASGWMGHNGNINGWITYPYYLPAEKTTIVMLINSSVNVLGSWSLFGTVVNTVTPHHPWPKPPAA
jgi:D-alanyl-D-alanine carboxypeptidase